MYCINLKDKNGLILGVSNKYSIAWSIANQLIKAGANLTLTYQDERIKPNIEELIRGLKKEPLLLKLDVTNQQEIEEVFQRIEGDHLDFLIHSIAYANREDLKGSILETSVDGFNTALDISTYSLIPLTKHALPLMDKGGSIITLTYQASQRVIPNYNVLGPAKAALEATVRQLAYELGSKNIRVNALSPSIVRTVAVKGIQGSSKLFEIHEEKSPLKRNVTSDDIAKAALFLLSDMSSGITGQVLYVDTGYNIMGI